MKLKHFAAKVLYSGMLKAFNPLVLRQDAWLINKKNPKAGHMITGIRKGRI